MLAHFPQLSQDVLLKMENTMVNILVIVVLYERIIHYILRFFSCLIVSLEAANWVITQDKVHLPLHDCISPPLHETLSTSETRPI